MKRILALGAALLCAAPTHASPACELFVWRIMENRQNGTSYFDLIQLVYRSFSTQDERDTWTEIVQDAYYNHEQGETEAARNVEILAFDKKHRAWCFW